MGDGERLRVENNEGGKEKLNKVNVFAGVRMLFGRSGSSHQNLVQNFCS